jgi:hypothetical protein
MSSHKPKREEKDMLDKLEEFFDEKVQPKVKEFEKLLKKDIELSDLKPEKLLEYDPDSPFSLRVPTRQAVASVAPSSKFWWTRWSSGWTRASAPSSSSSARRNVMTRKISTACRDFGRRARELVKAVRRIRESRS